MHYVIVIAIKDASICATIGLNSRQDLRRWSKILISQTHRNPFWNIWETKRMLWKTSIVFWYPYLDSVDFYV